MSQQPPDPAGTGTPYQALPSQINYQVPGSPYSTGEVADGGPDAIEAANVATSGGGGLLSSDPESEPAAGEPAVTEAPATEEPPVEEPAPPETP